VTKEGGGSASAAPPAAGLAGWWGRVRANPRRAIDEARLLWVLRARPQPKSAAAGSSEDSTQLLPAAVAGAHTPQAAIAAAWRDPERRPWLVAGALALVLVLALVVAVPLRGRPAQAPATPAAEATQPPGQPAEAEPPPAAAQPAQPEQPAQPAQPAEPPPESPPAPAQPGPPSGGIQPGLVQLGLAALPLLLGLFWLLSAWLVDAEARRAFVVQEPWGERRTVAYSCLAVGCVFPLILAGLIFAAWGFVSFVVYVANQHNWITGIQAGALVLLVCASILIARGIAVRWRTSRQ
jgi:hypothetical protein